MGLLLAAGCSDEPSDPSPPAPVPPAAPANLYALPGHDTDDILLNWSAVGGATSYTVYRGDAPGVTPTTGTPIPAGAATYTFDSNRPPGTYYYVVTASKDTTEGAASAEAGIVFEPGFAITAIRPTPERFVGTQLTVDLTIMSTLELASVTAEVADRSALLQFAGPSGAGGRWRATIDLGGLTHGLLRMGLVLTDAGGHRVETSVPFVYDTRPELDLVAPVNYAVARPDVHVTATCTDDSGNCASLSIYSVDETKVPVAELFSTTQTAVDVDVSPATSLLRFVVTDATGQADTVYRRVTTESPEAVVLQATATVPGRVLDADADRILYLDSTATDAQSVRIRDRGTGADVTLGSGFRMLRGPAYLTPTGALFIQVSPVLPAPQTLLEWRNGVSTDLGTASDLHVSGPYAGYVAGSFPDLTLIRRNTITGTATTIAADPSGSGNDVASNGNVAYWTADKDVWLFQDGAGAGQISPEVGENTSPVTDGVNVVYARRTLRASSQWLWEIERYDGATTTVLAPERAQDIRSVADYAVNNGWIAFTKPGTGGFLQVWTRSPSGEERQVTIGGTPSSIAALGPNGEVVSAEGAPSAPYHLHLPPYTGTPVDLGDGQATAFVFTGTALLKLVGNTVFTVTP